MLLHPLHEAASLKNLGMGAKQQSLIHPKEVKPETLDEFLYYQKNLF
jgi:hypothetical protein